MRQIRKDIFVKDTAINMKIISILNVHDPVLNDNREIYTTENNSYKIYMGFVSLRLMFKW